MKSTVKVSIGRMAFHLDADAHGALKDYLDKLEKYFSTRDSGKEIVSDIEERLSELLMARLTAPGQVVNLAMVQEVIAIMGMPDDMDDEPAQPKSAAKTPLTPVSRRKRLYRDTEHKVIGGVCSGLAAYFRIDVVLVRLIFVLFLIVSFSFHHFSFAFHHFEFSDITFLIYIILWIAVPPARTVKEKLEMRGLHNPTVADIERKILEDAERPSQSIFVRLVKGFFRAVLVIVGIAILMAALVGFVAVPWSLFMFDFVPDVPMIDLLNYVDIGSPLWLVKVLVGAVVLLPLLGLVYLGVKALTGFKGKYKAGLTIFLLWLTSVVGLSLVAVPAVNAHKQWSNLQEDREVINVYDTLYINVSEEYRNSRDKMILDFYDDDDFFAFWTDGAGRNTSFYLLPRVEIRHTRDTGNIRISYTRSAFGRSTYSAKQNVEALASKFLLRDSLLLLEPFVFDKENKWNGEMIDIKIYVPRNKAVKIDMLDGKRKYINIGKHKRGIHVNVREGDMDVDWD